MKYEIRGTETQSVEIELARGEAVYGRAGTHTRHDAAIATGAHVGGGLGAGAGHVFAAGRPTIVRFTATRRARIAFAAPVAGRVVARRLGRGEILICRRESLLCAERSVMLDLALRRRNPVGFFADDELVLERLTGPGTIFLALAGDAAQKLLAPGETLSFHADHLGLHEPSVVCDIEVGGSDEPTAAPRDDGFVATLTGPGRIWLQRLPLRALPEPVAHRRRPVAVPDTDRPVHVM